MKRTIVTGGAGFIGSHIVDRLLTLGHEVIVIDNESCDAHDRYYWNKACKNYKLDVRDIDSISPLFKGVDYVYHLAAMASVQESVESPLPTFITNAVGTANVLESARLAGCEKFIYSSTSAVYGETNPIPNQEIMRENPLNTYSIGKLSGEKLVESYYQLYGMKTATFRYTNVYGDRSRHVGSYAPVVGKFLSALSEGDPLTIYGDGEQRRDFIHVDDVVNVNSCISHMELDVWGQTYNIGYGKNWSIQQIADAICEEQIHLEPRLGEMRETLADITKATDELTWKPKVDILEWIRTKV